MRRHRIDWAAVTSTVFVTVPHCPECRSLDIERIRSEANGDGSLTRKTMCRSCGHVFKLVVELPFSGN